MPRSLVIALLSAVVGAGCFGVEFDDGVIACGSAGCPDGLTCAVDGYCYRDPADGDPAPDDPSGDPVSCAARVAHDYCSVLPPLPASPQIDGELDCGVALRPNPAAHWLGGARQDPPSDHRSEVAVGWRPDGIYVYVRVYEPELDPARSDDAVFDGDAVEIYVDDDGRFGSAPAYDGEGTRQFVAAAPEASATSRWGRVYRDMVDIGSWDVDSFVAVSTGDGYAVEAFVRMDQLGRPDRLLGAGERVGFDLGVNISRDSNRQGNRGDDYLGQYFLRVASSGAPWPFENVSAFCTPELLP